MIKRVLGAGRRSGNGGMGFGRVLMKYAASQGKTPGDIDLKNEIGLTAGEVYNALEGRGEVPLSEVRMQVGEKGPLFAAALGWLLREDKVELKVIGEGLRITLK
ncbi:MAG: winged helix-turn-helix domain-containing protein [Candidatus Altiarchaeota archaeon]|nr:winged helix-turn-helix domain-containing protein [Candidatus Altiarchaeota archaeon]